ncbi:MAG: hypothetical protein AAGG65_15460 [Pseudomonadota bacterium]
MRFARRHPAVLVGIIAALLALADNVYRRGPPTLIADWAALVIAVVAVGLAAAIVFAWGRGRLRRGRA